MNWRGKPLSSHEVVVHLTIAATGTRTGLKVRAELDDAEYPTGAEVSYAQMKALPVHDQQREASLDERRGHRPRLNARVPAAGPPVPSDARDALRKLGDLLG